MFVRTASKCFNRLAGVTLGLGIACTVFAVTAQAQAPNKKTTLTFSQPIEIPGVGSQVLPAGTYVFKLLDSSTDRHIVQILSKDEKHLFATVLAIPNYRLKTTNHTTITFAERADGSPAALRAWFKGGDNWGQEFVYPKARAMEIAKITNQPVLFVPSELADTIVAPVETATAPPVIALMQAPIMAYKPTGDVVPMTEVIQAPPAQVAAASPTKKLPKTSDNLALIGMLGLLSIGAAATLRKMLSL